MGPGHENGLAIKWGRIAHCACSRDKVTIRTRTSRKKGGRDRDRFSQGKAESRNSRLALSVRNLGLSCAEREYHVAELDSAWKQSKNSLSRRFNSQQSRGFFEASSTSRRSIGDSFVTQCRSWVATCWSGSGIVVLRMDANSDLNRHGIGAGSPAQVPVGVPVTVQLAAGNTAFGFVVPTFSDSVKLTSSDNANVAQHYLVSGWSCHFLGHPQHGRLADIEGDRHHGFVACRHGDNNRSGRATLPRSFRCCCRGASRPAMRCQLPLYPRLPRANRYPITQGR